MTFNNLRIVFMFCMSILNTPITFDGHTFTLWNVVVFGVVGSLVGYGIGKLLNIWGN